MLLLGFLLLPASVQGYSLSPQQIAPGVYMFEGATEHFTRDNKGDIANTGFIVGEDGVLVFDTGPSRNYGQSMRLAIATVTDKPVVAVYVSHHHPDHFLGNQAFGDVPIHALEHTIETIRRDGDAVTDSLYRLVGTPMAGTEPVEPGELVTLGRQTVAGRDIELIAAGGHGGDGHADLMLLDHASGVLFAGDLVFHERAPTTPNAELGQWHDALDRIEELDFRVLVPGHGPPARGPEPVQQTRDYLRWLEEHLHEAAAAGLDAAEVMYLDLPDRFQHMGVLEQEYRRSVAHLYPDIERATLRDVREP
nr:quinoprotein relay system zinc metallohydrolase 1 [Methylonatrum kenyense]